MKKIWIFSAAVLLILTPVLTKAFSRDLVLPPSNINFNANTFLEGRTIRIYAKITSASTEDLLGVVKFFDNGTQIHGDQPISVLAKNEDSVFVDWAPSQGEHKIKISLIPFEETEDNPANNTFEKTITVLADTDRDGTPNIEDTDDDNDGVPDDKDAFPLNKNESLDSDGDSIGNNKDDDDDNDGIKDAQDAFPVDATESIDTDKDGIGNNSDLDDDGDGLPDLDELKLGTDPLKPDTDGDGVNDKEDAYPLDPTQSRDFDRDGISDEKDNDADNDGIPKETDINDTNLGPQVNITSDGKAISKIIYPNKTVTFESVTSIDPDGKIVKAQWSLDGQEQTGENLKISFPSSGSHKLVLKLTDDKGESREKKFTFYVVPPVALWILVIAAFLIIILAIFLIFSYSKRRVSKLEKVNKTLDLILRILPKPTKRK